MKEIEVTIDTNGECSVDLVGWNGKGCAEVMEKITRALGKVVTSDKKCEYWKPEIKQKQKISHGS